MSGTARPLRLCAVMTRTGQLLVYLYGPQLRSELVLRNVTLWDGLGFNFPPC